MLHRLIIPGVLLMILVPASLADPALLPPVRFMLHGNMSAEPPGEDYLRFVEEAKPDILIMGVFDQRLYGLAVPPPDAKAKPAKPAELLARWKAVADRLHRNGIRLIGQMELNVVSDRPLDLPQGAGWVGYYDKAWDEQRLGRRPTQSAAELLEEPDLDRPGKPVPALPEADAVARCGCRVNTRAVRGCINKPAWRELQKRLVKAAVEIGVDGFITNRNYFGHCGCDHCRQKFRHWLAGRYPAGELKARFGIGSLALHPLTCVVGAHREIDKVPHELVLEKQRFAKHMVKECFDEVYVKYGRSLRPNLFVAQWNHLAFFDELHLDRGHLPPASRTTFAHAAADERWSLPPELWARDEDLIWYCNWGTTQNTILDKEYAADTVLYGKYVRALAAGKPYVVNKYDFYRPRAMMAEALALGYATNAIATPWQSEEDRAVVLRYFAFLKKHALLYRDADSYAEVGLVFPRRAIHGGDASPLEYVESAGRTMVRQHVLFDMLPDDLLPGLPLAHYRAIIVTAPAYLHKPEREALVRYLAGGGKLLLLPVSREDRDRADAVGTGARRLLESAQPLNLKATIVPQARTERAGFLKQLQDVLGAPEQASRFDAPWTVEVHAYRQQAQRRLLLHLVNYNHQEKAPGRSVTAREAPLAADPVAIRLRLPERFQVRSVRFHSPDDDREHVLQFQERDRFLECKTPSFLVYGMLVVNE